MSSLRELIELHSELIDLESAAEIKEVEMRFKNLSEDELEQKGWVTLGLTAKRCFTGTGGAPLVTLVKLDGCEEVKLPASKMKQGAMIGIFRASSEFRL